jgi:hypothetical protein
MYPWCLYPPNLISSSNSHGSNLNQKGIWYVTILSPSGSLKDKSRQQCKPKQLSVISHCTIFLTLEGKYFCGFIIKGQALKIKHILPCTSYKAMLLNTSDVNVIKSTT